MKQADGQVSAGAQTTDQRPAARPSLLPLWLAIAAIVSPAFFAVSFLVMGLGVAAGIAAVVLALRQRTHGERGAVTRWATALGAIGVLVNVVLVAVAIVIAAAPGPVEVEVEAYGGSLFTATYGVGGEVTTKEWATDGWKKFGTSESSAVITVTPQTDPVGGIDVEHGCRIIWDGEVVAEESSDSGEVTCSYEK